MQPLPSRHAFLPSLTCCRSFLTQPVARHAPHAGLLYLEPHPHALLPTMASELKTRLRLRLRQLQGATATMEICSGLVHSADAPPLPNPGGCHHKVQGPRPHHRRTALIAAQLGPPWQYVKAPAAHTLTLPHCCRVGLDAVCLQGQQRSGHAVPALDRADAAGLMEKRSRKAD